MLWGDSSDFELEMNNSVGQEDVKITNWSLVDGSHYERQVEYVKRSALVTCSVVQSQRFRLKSATEANFETTSQMSGIPMVASDAFTAHSKWKLTEEGDKTSISVFIRTDWVKSSMIKGKVDKETIKGMTEFFQSFASLAQKKIRVAKGGPAEAPEDSNKPQIQATNAQGGNFLLYITILLALIVLVLGAFTVYLSLSNSNWYRVCVLEDEKYAFLLESTPPSRFSSDPSLVIEQLLTEIAALRKTAVEMTA